MNQFSIYGETNFVSITLDEVYGFPDTVSHLGGYKARTSLKIKSGDFQVNAILWTSTGALYELWQQLKECNHRLSGDVYFNSFEHNFDLFLSYDKTGHVTVSGKFSEESSLKNELHFEFISDQSFIALTIQELEVLVEKYGDQNGMNK